MMKNSQAGAFEDDDGYDNAFEDHSIIKKYFGGQQLFYEAKPMLKKAVVKVFLFLTCNSLANFVSFDMEINNLNENITKKQCHKM